MDKIKCNNTDATNKKLNAFGHGNGLDLKKGNYGLKNTQIVSCNSIGMGCGHGRCFFKEREEILKNNDDFLESDDE
ncbi:unnamed protein product [Brachionus calyciflorus]|uniref:Uncharacterized protein n=1 Tax=Brachionus calyciflorus TaxID=104777 RepID=A0A813P3Q0_9BILA|nr:unnamed protein product [Brachionus calyciflorus]